MFVISMFHYITAEERSSFQQFSADIYQLLICSAFCFPV